MKKQIEEIRNIRPNFFNAEGTVKLAVKQGKKQRVRDVTKRNKEKEICLNCNSPKCNGNCKKVQAKHTEEP